jgi:hypothetical protein
MLLFVFCRSDFRLPRHLEFLFRLVSSVAPPLGFGFAVQILSGPNCSVWFRFLR